MIKAIKSGAISEAESRIGIVRNSLYLEIRLNNKNRVNFTVSDWYSKVWKNQREQMIRMSNGTKRIHFSLGSCLKR